MIDAHVHVWQIGRHDCVWPGPDLPTLHRDVTMAELWASVPAEAQVLLVQSQESERDTRWLLSLAAGEPRVAGVIGWTELSAGDAPARIDALAAAGRLCGIRPMVQDRVADWYDNPAIDPALAHLAARGLVLDALVRPGHLPGVARLAERHPTLRIVIDHAAKPAIGGDDTAWRDGMAAVARHANVACKVSGLLTEVVDGHTADAVRPVIAELLALFGPDRLIWGSDWPVVTLRGDYAQWLDLARDAVPREHHAAVFGRTACTFYTLPAAAGERLA